MSEPKKIEELFNEFIAECKYSAKVSVVTIRGYTSSFGLLMKLNPDLDIDNLSRETFTKFFERLEKRERLVGKKTKIGVKKSTIATYYSKLNTFMTWLVNNKYIDQSPLNNLNPPTVYYNDRKYRIFF